MDRKVVDTNGRERTYAGFTIRVFASLADTFVLVIPTVILVTLALMILGETVDGTQIQVMSGGVYLGLGFAYFSVSHTRYGTTLGKRVFRIYVCDAATGEHLKLGQSILRSFGYLASQLLGGVGFLMALFHPKNMTLHDLLAQSEVVRRPSGKILS